MEQQVSLARSRLLSAAVSAILAAGAAQAAEDPVIAEVTVTATRRATDIQDVPLNITAVGSAEIQNARDHESGGRFAICARAVRH